MNEPVRGLVLAHASLAAALISATRKICGCETEALRPLTNEGRGPEALLDGVRQALGEAPALLFTDLGSGSCTLAARKILLERPETGLITGVNLPILVDFVFHRDLPLPELTERLLEKGRAGISGRCTAARIDCGNVDRSVTS